MDPRYASFIWGSYGIALLVVLWNLFAPRLARNELRRRLSDQRSETEEQAPTERSGGGGGETVHGGDADGGGGDGGGD